MPVDEAARFAWDESPNWRPMRRVRLQAYGRHDAAGLRYARGDRQRGRISRCGSAFALGLCLQTELVASPPEFFDGLEQVAPLPGELGHSLVCSAQLLPQHLLGARNTVNAQLCIGCSLFRGLQSAAQTRAFLSRRFRTSLCFRGRPPNLLHAALLIIAIVVPVQLEGLHAVGDSRARRWQPPPPRSRRLRGQRSLRRLCCPRQLLAEKFGQLLGRGIFFLLVQGTFVPQTHRRGAGQAFRLAGNEAT
mmetsp:Transcript_6213/g.15429  ORF Transcript_6213/g.15429 Transcript_6213/m.15429 type:complete len:248 (+) Transcript_6213:1107-1850(+)